MVFFYCVGPTCILLSQVTVETESFSFHIIIMVYAFQCVNLCLHAVCSNTVSRLGQCLMWPACFFFSFKIFLVVSDDHKLLRQLTIHFPLVLSVKGRDWLAKCVCVCAHACFSCECFDCLGCYLPHLNSSQLI